MYQIQYLSFQNYIPVEASLPEGKNIKVIVFK